MNNDDDDEQLVLLNSENTDETDLSPEHQPCGGRTSSKESDDRLLFDAQNVINEHELLLGEQPRTNTTASFHDESVYFHYVINRSAHTEENFKERVAGPEVLPEVPTIKQRAKCCIKKCNRNSIAHAFFSLFPILTWLRHYDIRNWLPSDIISGLTVGVVHIPQSMAFSLLAGLPPVFGLYTSFYPVIIYTLMGTSRHISVGTFAVTSLLTQTVVLKLVPNQPQNVSILMNVSASTTASEVAGISDIDARKVVVASTLMFLMGLFQLAFGLLRLGFITTYLSEPLIQAFTTGAALHVVTSQAPSIFGIRIQASSGIGSIFRNWVEIFRNLPSTNVATLIISIVCIILLIIGREVNKRYREKLKVSIPTEVIVVAIATISSHFGMFKENFQVNVVDNIPTGLPPPQLPDFSILGEIVGDAFAVAIVGFAISISLAKLYAQKHGYCIDSNQELIAYGVSNVVPSFFSCFPNAAALARCVIQDNTGGKTQVVGIISVVVVLVTILALGPVFEPLPRSVLGCIIIVGLFGIIQQLSILKIVRKQSTYDFMIWIFTLAAVVILGVDLGLLASVIFSLFTVILRTQLPIYETLGSVKGTDVYRNCNSFHTALPYPGITIFKFHSSLYYANKDYFNQKLFKAVGVNPETEIIRRRREMNEGGGSNPDTNVCTLRNIRPMDPDCDAEDLDKLEKSGGNCCEVRPRRDQLPHSVIIDCSAFAFIDLAGVKTLKAIYKSYQEIEINVLLANVSCQVRNLLYNISYYELAGHEREFISVHDAAIFAMSSKRHNDAEAETTIC